MDKLTLVKLPKIQSAASVVVRIDGDTYAEVAQLAAVTQMPVARLVSTLLTFSLERVELIDPTNEKSPSPATTERKGKDQ